MIPALVPNSWTQAILLPYPSSLGLVALKITSSSNMQFYLAANMAA